MFFLKAQEIYDLRENFEFCSGVELHEFFRKSFDGEPSPAGREMIFKDSAINFVVGCCLSIEANSPSISMQDCLAALRDIGDKNFDAPDLSIGTLQPLHRHDCEWCMYLGSIRGVDLYLHPGAMTEVVARYSEDGYFSASVEGIKSPNPFLIEAARRAEKFIV